MTSRTAFSLKRRMLIREGALLVSMTLKAGCVGAGGKPGLLQLKTAMRVVAVTAFHRPFQHLVVKRLVEIRLNFAVATNAKLWLPNFQQMDGGETGLFSV
jgi:hypothetical protein